jgi:hypothetical protein
MAAAPEATAVEPSAMEAPTVEAAAMEASTARVGLGRRTQRDGDQGHARKGRQDGFQKRLQLDLHFPEAVGHY